MFAPLVVASFLLIGVIPTAECFAAPDVLYYSPGLKMNSILSVMPTNNNNRKTKANQQRPRIGRQLSIRDSLPNLMASDAKMPKSCVDWIKSSMTKGYNLSELASGNEAVYFNELLIL